MNTLLLLFIFHCLLCNMYIAIVYISCISLNIIILNPQKLYNTVETLYSGHPYIVPRQVDAAENGHYGEFMCYLMMRLML